MATYLGNKEVTIIKDIFVSTDISSYFNGTLQYISENQLKGITKVRESAFRKQTSLRNITLPDTITEIGDNAFNGCNLLNYISFKSTTPPTITTRSLSGIPTSTTLYVPVGYGDTYKAANNWSSYASRIVERG